MNGHQQGGGGGGNRIIRAATHTDKVSGNVDRRYARADIAFVGWGGHSQIVKLGGRS